MKNAFDDLRSRLDPAFSADTASPGHPWVMPSAGHCAAVAVIVAHRLGCQIVSARVCGVSHWFNRLDHDGQAFDVDLTGDQSGLDRVQIANAGDLYPETRVRELSEVTAETLARSRLLEARMKP